MYPKQSFGFSLPEVIIAMAFFTIITAGVSLFAVYYFGNYTFSFEENQSITEARNGISIMLHDLRETRYGVDGSWPLVDTGDTTITFFSDVTNDGVSDKVRYFLENSSLRRGVIEPTTDTLEYLPQNEQYLTIAQYVDVSAGPIFTYYNGLWPSDTVNNPLIPEVRKLNTRYIEISLSINISENFSAQPFTLNSGVQLRGIKDTL